MGVGIWGGGGGRGRVINKNSKLNICASFFVMYSLMFLLWVWRGGQFSFDCSSDFPMDQFLVTVFPGSLCLS